MKKLILLTLVAFFSIQTYAQPGNPAFANTLDGYYKVKNALADDKGEEASKNATELIANLKNFPTQQLTPEQLAVWKKESPLIGKAAASIASSKKISDQRKTFVAVSNAMITLAKTIKVSNKKTYLQYCPMVKAYWLNEVEAVQNPYYGSMMYDCGEVKQTL